MCPKVDMQKTLVVVKPGGYARGLVGDVIKRLEQKGLVISGLKMMQFSDYLAREFYEVHEGKSFYESLIAYMVSGSVVAIVVAGLYAVEDVRQLVGDTWQASPGTIRGDFSSSRSAANVVHASDSVESAEREIELLFKEDEVFKAGRGSFCWVYSNQELLDSIE